jgi:hypothetical protein
VNPLKTKGMLGAFGIGTNGTQLYILLHCAVFHAKPRADESSFQTREEKAKLSAPLPYGEDISGRRQRH